MDRYVKLFGVASAMFWLAACQRDEPLAPSPTTAPSATAPEQSAAVATPVAATADTEVRVESGPGWGFRAEWPKSLARHPPLLQRVLAEIDAGRREIEGYARPPGEPVAADSEPVEEGQDPVDAPVETQMVWSVAVETPTLISVVLEGYSYTGGAHGMPLQQAIHFDPVANRELKPIDLLVGPKDWLVISEQVRAELYRRLEEQIRELPPEQQNDAREPSRAWIDEGTQAGADWLGRFIPKLGADGRVEILTFIFPPYQVGPYADGTQAVDVPVAALRGRLTPEWARALGVAR